MRKLDLTATHRLMYGPAPPSPSRPLPCNPRYKELREDIADKWLTSQTWAIARSSSNWQPRFQGQYHSSRVIVTSAAGTPDTVGLTTQVHPARPAGCACGGGVDGNKRAGLAYL